MEMSTKIKAIMKKFKICLFRKNKKGNKLWQWIKYSLVGSIIPIVISIGYDRWLGYNFSLSDVEYLSDFVLVTVSLAAGILSGLDRDNKHKLFEVPLLGDLPIISVTLGLAVYSFTFRRKSGVFDSEMTKIIFVVAIALYMINLFLGILSERKKTVDEEVIDE